MSRHRSTFALLACAVLAGCSAGNSGSSYIPTPYTGSTISIAPATGAVQSTTVAGDLVFVRVGPLYVLETEVTAGQWQAVMGTAPWTGAPVSVDASAPAINLSWEDANAFASTLRSKTSLQVRLPTAAEWQSWYPMDYPWGNDSADPRRADFAWVRETAPFGGVRPAKSGSTVSGLYNLCGNAREWTLDGFLCGGGWCDNIAVVPRTIRIVSVPQSIRHPSAGFRLVIIQ